MIVNLGENAADIEKTLLGFEKQITRGQEPETEEEGGITWRRLPTPPSAPPVVWGVRGRYLLVAVGDKVGPAMMGRARNNPPQWLSNLKARLPVERVSVVSYLNVAAVQELAGPFLLVPPVSGIIQSLSVDRVQALVSVSGLDATGCLSQTLIQLDKSKAAPQGLLELASSEPLTANDLAHIPADATIAAALRLDSTKVWKWIGNLVSQIEPSSQRDLQQVRAIIQEVAGADLETEILPAFGDVWTIHASPADGGFPWTGAVASVSVKDHPFLSKMNARLVDMVKQNLPDPPENGRRNYATLRSVKAGEDTVYFMNIVEREMGVAPAWCLTKERLIVALYPQSIQGALAIGSSEKRLASVPEVAAQFNGSSSPTGLSYVDTRSLFRTFYPVFQIGVQMAAASWQREGIQLDVSVLPPARTIERHLQPTVMTFTRKPDGFEFSNRQSLPGVSLMGVAPVLAGLSLPAVMAAREAARLNQDINTLKNLMLAMHNHHDVYNRLPAAQWGTKGNKGLSWRVAILPFIEELALYDQFHHDEPWDSEHNLKLIEKMPALYRSTAQPPIPVAADKPRPPAEDGKVDESKYAAYRTPFLTLRHADSIFPPDIEKGLGFKTITDGTSKTIGIVRAAPEQAVIWTKPDDLPFDPDTPFAGLIGPGGAFLAAFCDGHVMRFTQAIGEENMKALMTRKGGEPLDNDRLYGHE